MDWKDIIRDKPELKHVKLRTQFLVKGYFQINGSKGDTHYRTERLCGYFADDTILFEEPSNFVLLEWCYID